MQKNREIAVRRGTLRLKPSEKLIPYRKMTIEKVSHALPRARLRWYRRGLQDADHLAAGLDASARWQCPIQIVAPRLMMRRDAGGFFFVDLVRPSGGAAS